MKGYELEEKYRRVEREVGGWVGGCCAPVMEGGSLIEAVAARPPAGFLPPPLPFPSSPLLARSLAPYLACSLSSSIAPSLSLPPTLSLPFSTLLVQQRDLWSRLIHAVLHFVLQICVYLHVRAVLQEAEGHWTFWHRHLLGGCLHGDKCKNREKTGSCNFGSREYTKHIVSGGCKDLHACKSFTRLWCSDSRFC